MVIPVKPVEKIFGPGNSFVVEAKRQLVGAVSIDLLRNASYDLRIFIIHSGFTMKQYDPPAVPGSKAARFTRGRLLITLTSAGTPPYYVNTSCLPAGSKNM